MVPHIRADYASPAPDLLYAMRVRRPFTPTNLELGSLARLDVCHGQPHEGRGISRLKEHAKSRSFELNFMGVPNTTNDPEQTPYRELSKLIGGTIKNLPPPPRGTAQVPLASFISPTLSKHIPMPSTPRGQCSTHERSSNPTPHTSHLSLSKLESVVRAVVFRATR